MKNRFIILMILVIIFSCKKNDNGVPGYTLKGTLKSINGSVSNTDILLEGATVYHTKSDDNGNFEIKGVEKGMYTLNCKQDSNDSSFTGNSVKLKITNDTVISNLELPKPVIMFNPKNVTSSSVDVSWSKCNSQGFYEYKVFRKEDSGLDETTGKLIHVATEADDTIFTDNSLAESTKYYYRVYVMNNYGKLGGSKIVNIQTVKGNYVTNGSFETFDTNLIADAWTYNNSDPSFDFKNYAKVINDTSLPDGSYYLSIDIPVYHYALSFGDIYQQINNTYIQSGVKYELSVWVKILEMGTGAQCYVECYNGTYIPEQRITINSSDTKNEWNKY
jgi:hypothetical protein